jgi:hypothetical protein
MTRRAKVWLVVAVLFTVANAGAAVVAASWGQPRHAGVHVALALLGAWLAWQLAPRRDAPARPRELDDRLAHLEQSVDAVAVEIERIGEGQRFLTRFFTERPARAGRQGDGEPVENRDQASTAPIRG